MAFAPVITASLVVLNHVIRAMTDARRAAQRKDAAPA